MVVFGEVRLVPISDLKPHERTIPETLGELVRSISEKGFFGPPVLIDSHSRAILDGHHRAGALRALGCFFAPAILVSYSQVRVIHFSDPSKEFPKALVFSAALSGKTFPPKTTRHIYPALEPVSFSLEILRMSEKKGDEERTE
ncbi:MAG: ParB N-terminal domain-containing protein [archaeon]